MPNSYPYFKIKSKIGMGRRGKHRDGCPSLIPPPPLQPPLGFHRKYFLILSMAGPSSSPSSESLSNGSLPLSAHIVPLGDNYPAPVPPATTYLGGSTLPPRPRRPSSVEFHVRPCIFPTGSYRLLRISVTVCLRPEPVAVWDLHYATGLRPL